MTQDLRALIERVEGLTKACRDVDLRPSGREPIALILSMLLALEAIHAG